MFTKRVLVSVVIPVAASIALAGCDSGGSTNSASFQPAAAARKLRALGRIEVKGKATLNGERRTIGGLVQYRPYRVLEALPVANGPGVDTVEYRRRGNDAWVRRALVRPGTAGSLGFPLLVLRRADQLPFLPLPLPDVGTTAQLGTGYDPALLLDRLAKLPTVTFKKGKDAGSYVATLALRPAAIVGVRTLTVHVDSSGVPDRFDLTTLFNIRVRYTVNASSRTPKVTAPPAPQIEAISKPLPDATGPFVPVFQGSAGTTAIEITQAPGTDGWTCWKVASTPPYIGIERSTRQSGAMCIPPVTDVASDDEKFGIPIDANDQTPYELIGVVVPPGSSADLTLLDGRTQPMTVTPGGLALYAGPPEPAAALVHIHTPRGGDLVCGPGPINTESDIAKVTDARSIRSDPWNCLPKDIADALGF